MAHLHNITDTDKRFRIDPITRAVKHVSDNVNPIQYDTNSVRFVFELPRIIEGHDMTLCDKVEIHYINFASATEKNEGVYLVDDLTVDEWAEDKAYFSWLLSANATKYAGPLNFLIRFICLEGETVIYAWHTDICKDISVCDGINNSAAAIEMSTDVLEAWKKEVLGDLEKVANEAIVRAENAAGRAEEAAEKLEKILDGAGGSGDGGPSSGSASTIGTVGEVEYVSTDGNVDTYIMRLTTGEEYTFAVINSTGDSGSGDSGSGDSGSGDSGSGDSGSGDAYTKMTVNLSVKPSYIGYAEAVKDAKLTWSVSEEASSIVLICPDGSTVDLSDKSSPYTDPNTYIVTSDKTWTLKATRKDGQQETVTDSAKLWWNHRVYCGFSNEASYTDDKFTTDLSSTLTKSRQTTFDFSQVNNQYVYFAAPKDLYSSKEPTLQIGDFLPGGFKPKQEITVEKNGESIVYYLYRSYNLLDYDWPFSVYSK